MAKKIKTKKIENWNIFYEENILEIGISKMYAETDQICIAELTGSYELLEYDIDPNTTYDNSDLNKYELLENKVKFKGDCPFLKESVTEAILNGVFRYLLDYINLVNTTIRIGKEYNKAKGNN